jgi:hypothetical protein
MFHYTRVLRNLLLAAGIAAALAGCGQDAATEQAGPPAGGPGGARPGATGQVVSVDGSRLVLKDQRQGADITITLNESTQVFKQATVTLDQLAAGETIIATGALEGDVFVASSVRVGQAGGFPGGGPGRNGQAPPGDGTARPPAGGTPQPPRDGAAQPGRGPGERLTGTLEKVAGDTLTVKTADGATVQARLAADARIMKSVAGALSDLAAGAQVMVTGEQNGDALVAARVEIMAQTP